MKMRPSPYPKVKKTSLFSRGVPNLEYSKGGTIGYESIRQYCGRRFITRATLRTFARKGWIVVIKGTKTRISIKELCPDEINQWLT